MRSLGISEGGASSKKVKKVVVLRRLESDLDSMGVEEERSRG